MSDYTIEFFSHETDSPVADCLFFVSIDGLVVGTGEICNAGTEYQFYKYAGHAVPGWNYYDTYRCFPDTKDELITQVIEKYTFIMNGKPVPPNLYHS